MFQAIRSIFFSNLKQKIKGSLKQSMSTFVSKLSPTTGEVEWVMQDDDYDYHQEVARSAYADMLHDTERNQLYYEALREAVNKFHERGKEAHVLDIGTGTGLLSMMAVKCGADSITACEVFEPMAECASQVMTDNKMRDKIKLVRKRSTDVTVGPDGDMPRRANILVTEVFDTELIGEGAIPTFHHAHQHLLEKDCIVVPSAANMYVQVVYSDTARRWNTLQPIQIEGDNYIIPPPEMTSCRGAVVLHDLQLDQVSADKFQPITDPIRCFRFDYSGKSAIQTGCHSAKKVTSLISGRCDAVFMWWDLQMDTEGKIMLSCAPRWAHPTPKHMQWRDHWMQAIYYPQNKLTVEKGEDLVVHSNHDEYSLWFDVTKPDKENEAAKAAAMCTCGAHVAYSRPRLGTINNMHKNQAYVQALKKVIDKDSICMCISDGSMLSLMAAKLGAKKVYVLEQERMSNAVIQKYVKHNHLSDVITVINKRAEAVTSTDLEGNKVSVVLGEPHFSTSTLPWHNILYWYARTHITDHLSEKPQVLPCCATMRAIAVDFSDLYKIRAPVGICEGFDLHTFDKLIENSSEIADAYVEPQPLWEYPGTPLTDQVGLLQFDFTKPLTGLRTVNRQGFINFHSSGTCNGVAVWMEFHHGNKTVISTGLVAPPKTGENLQWEENYRQGVHLLKTPVKVDLQNGAMMKLRYKVTFKPQTGDIDFVFAVAR